jgi:hypothetical protein
VTGHRTVVIRKATLRRPTPPVTVREITLWQRTDMRYQISITTYREDDPGKATPRRVFGLLRQWQDGDVQTERELVAAAIGLGAGTYGGPLSAAE